MVTAPTNGTNDICIVGAGPIGMMTALFLSSPKRSITLIGKEPKDDQRTTALWGQAIDFLKTLGVWADLEGRSAIIRSMRLVDGTKRLIRTPEVRYDASEIGRNAFGYNMKNADLAKVLAEAINRTPGLVWIKDQVETLKIDEDGCSLKTDTDITLQPRLIAGADGYHSIVRQAAGIGSRTWNYPQTALVTDFDHTLPHHDVSTEFHTETGPFTLVPLTERSSSLVWVETPEKAEELQGQSLANLSNLIAEKSHYLLGDVSVLKQPSAFPLRGAIAKKAGHFNAVLIGEAAHTFPPIGAQGMNLGIRDILGLGKALGKKQTHDKLYTVESIVDDYCNLRRADIITRTNAIDFLNRSLLTEFLPVHLSRGLALYASDRFPFVKKHLIKKGLGLQEKIV